MVDRDDVRDIGEQAQARGREAGRAVEQSKPYRWLVMIGLVCYGIVHLLIAWVAAQLALGSSGGGEEASTSGALRSLAEQPLGEVLMVVITVGFGTLVVWQLMLALFGHREFDGLKRVRMRVTSGAKVLLYAALGLSAGRLALAPDADEGGDGETQRSLTSDLMGLPFGRVLVMVVALAIIGIGIGQIVKGVRQSFEDELSGSPGTAARALGTTGYVAKGVSIAAVGALFGWAAISFDPNKAGGTDQALRAILEQPFGVVLLLAVAVGFAAFGLYCFYWSRHVRFSGA